MANAEKLIEKMKKNIKAKDYLELPYHITVQRINDESGSYYYATVREFDGCMSDGETIVKPMKISSKPWKTGSKQNLKAASLFRSLLTTANLAVNLFCVFPKPFMLVLPWKLKKKVYPLINMQYTN